MNFSKRLTDKDGNLLPLDPIIEMALGSIPERSSEVKFGYNLDIDSSTPETAWAAGGRYQHFDTAEYLSISSSSTDDDFGASGSGAHYVLITGVCTEFKDQEELIVLDGQETVTSSVPWRGINRALVIKAGSGETNAGTITFTGATSSQTMATIPAGKGVTQQLVINVPTNKTAIIDDVYWDAIKDSQGSDPIVTIDLIARQPSPFGGHIAVGIYERKFDTELVQIMSERLARRKITGPATVECVVSTSVNNLQFFGNINYYLVETAQINDLAAPA